MNCLWIFIEKECVLKFLWYELLLLGDRSKKGRMTQMGTHYRTILWLKGMAKELELDEPDKELIWELIIKLI